MNMISLPRPECPYCHEAMRRWPLGQHMLVCDTCRRPIVRYLAAPSRRIFRLRPLYSVINAIALIVLIARYRLNPFISVTLVSIGLALLAGMPAPEILPAYEQGVGKTLGHIALIVALGTVVSGFPSGELFALRVENGRTMWQDQLSRSGRTTALGAAYEAAVAPFIWSASGRENFVDDARAMRRLLLATLLASFLPSVSQAADADIDFVEHQRRHARGLCRDHLDRQADP